MSMKNESRELFLFALILVTFISCAQENAIDFTDLEGPYLGQEPPGITAELFAPKIVSTDNRENSPRFNSNLNEFYFRRNGKICVMKKENNKWTAPRVDEHLKKYKLGYYFFSLDGTRLLISPSEPLQTEKGQINRWDICIVEKEETEWGEPAYNNPNINSKEGDYHPTVSINGNLYFHSSRKGGEGGSDIYYAKYVDGHYLKPENLGPSINTERGEADPCIDPEETYLIFCAYDDEEDGNLDLFISFKEKNDSWRKPVNLGSRINSRGNEVVPYITPDGKYLLFCSNRKSKGDIYWVDAKIIEELKPKDLR